MKREGILNENILRIIGSMGHTDTIVICDAGLPVPKGVEKIDLAVVKGIPGFIDVLEAILKELVVEKVILAGEIKEDSPGMYKKVCDLVETIPVELVSHKEFKNMVAQSKAVIRTGEFTPYANIILQSGVDFK